MPRIKAGTERTAVKFASRRLGLFDELPGAVIVSQPMGAEEHGKPSVRVLMDTHGCLDEVWPQAAGRKL
jgi:hypothetical protein